MPEIDISHWKSEAEERRRIASASLVATNDECRRVFLAWEFTPCEITEEPPTFAHDRIGRRQEWAWLWDHTDIDFETLARYAGMSPTRARKIVDMLRGIAAIYPDGTTSEQVRGFLQANLARMVPAPARRPAQNRGAEDDE